MHPTLNMHIAIHCGGGDGGSTLLNACRIQTHASKQRRDGREGGTLKFYIPQQLRPRIRRRKGGALVAQYRSPWPVGWEICGYLARHHMKGVWIRDHTQCVYRDRGNKTKQEQDQDQEQNEWFRRHENFLANRKPSPHTPVRSSREQVAGRRRARSGAALLPVARS